MKKHSENQEKICEFLKILTDFLKILSENFGFRSEDLRGEIDSYKMLILPYKK